MNVDESGGDGESWEGGAMAAIKGALLKLNNAMNHKGHAAERKT